MARILMVSKPVAPPWNDSSKNLVRDVSSHLQRHRATVMTQRGAEPALRDVRHESVYGRATGGFAPALADNARVMLRLLAGSGHDIWHFFFAPNRRSSQACRFAAGVRRVPTVQTVCSAPARGADLGQLLFADRTVVLSLFTERQVLAAGAAPRRLARIPPAVAPLDVMDESSRMQVRRQFALPSDRPLVVYPGDLEFSGAAERTLRAHAAGLAKQGAWLALACRAKTAHARDHEQRLRLLSDELGVASSVTWIGETRGIHGLLAAADVVALPAENLYAKMDLPLVLIEAMLLERAVVVASGAPAEELAEGGAAIAAAPDVDATAKAIECLLFDRQSRALVGSRARQAALDRYHPAVVARAYEGLYDELLQ
jgi:phosphatidylinositol alpha-1,6-mannosyltransferase